MGQITEVHIVPGTLPATGDGELSPGRSDLTLLPTMPGAEITRSERSVIPVADAGRLAWWVVLSVAAIVPFLVAQFPPLYDFYHWVFQGHIAKLLLFGGSEGAGAINS